MIAGRRLRPIWHKPKGGEMIEVHKEKPKVVSILIAEVCDEPGDKSNCEERFVSGWTVAEVVAELFGEKPEKPKVKRTRRTKAEMIEATKDAAGLPTIEVCGDAPPVEKKVKREKAIWPKQ